MKKGEEKKEDDARKGLSDIRLALEEISLFEPEDKKISTLAFLGASNLLLHVLDKIGPTMQVLRHDIHRNIERLEKIYTVDPDLNSNLIEIVKKEVAEGTSRKAESCCRAILWLTRSMHFGETLIEKLDKNRELSFEQAVEETYSDTLKPWHGWIASAAYKVAIKLVPDRQTFIISLMGQDQDYKDLNHDVKVYASALQPLLDETYSLLRTYGLDNLKSS